MVEALAEVSPSIPDDDVLKHGTNVGGLLLTADKDFGELVFRQRMIHTGILLIRLAGLDPDRKGEIVAVCIDEYARAIADVFAVLTRRSLRVRPRTGG